MSGYRDIWTTLGIGRTSDVAAIRAAYARVLKSFDVDAEPQRFMALRQARDQALRLARQAAVADVADEVADDQPERDDAAPLQLATPVVPDAAEIAAHLAAAGAAPGTVSTAVPAAGDDYRDAAAPVVAADSGDGTALPDLTARATFAAPVIDEVQRAGSVGIAARDATHEALIDAHYTAVRALLYDGGAPDSYLDADQEVALAGHVDALLADPRLDQIAFRGQAETWFADMAANAVPRSDSIVERLVATFGWAADRGRIDQPRNVARVLARRDSLVFFRLVQEKKHPLNAAWRELVRPATADSRRGFGVKRGDVQRLLKVVRENFPDLESCFDWYRVSLWEGQGQGQPSRGGGGAWRPAYFGLILMLGVLRAVFSGSGDHAPPNAIATFAEIKADDQVSDVALALRAATGGMLTNEDVAKHNPALQALLAARWKEAHDRRDSQADFVERTANDLIRRADAVIGHASYPLAAESRQLELDRLKAARAHTPPVCQLTMEGGSASPDLAARFRDRENALTRHALLESDARDATPRPEHFTFMVPGAVMKDAGARAGLSRDDLAKALTHRSTPTRACDARIALLEAALALPRRDGLKLLRAM